MLLYECYCVTNLLRRVFLNIIFSVAKRRSKLKYRYAVLKLKSL